MKIDYVFLNRYRNFADAHINLAKNSLVIGSNDVGKTNMIHALRLLLDKSLSEAEIEPTTQDFHCAQDGTQADYFVIRIAFSEVTQDAVLSQLKGFVSATGHFFLEFRATRADHRYEIAAGYDPTAMEVIPSRYYLKHLHLKYIHSQRDLVRYIRSEKRHLLRLAQESRDQVQLDADTIQLQTLAGLLESVNAGVKRLHYVAEATQDLNNELRALSHHNVGYNVSLDTGAIGIEQFIEQLELGASTNGSRVMLGGDGRNNQILLALWKAKSVLEHDRDSEVVIYCVEEPEAHLHPHQQRKLASYLISALPGQTIVTTHSPQIAASYRPDSVVRLLRNNGASRAASQGCSDCIDSAWTGLGYRISIVPAEAFFASAVMLVEGPSEMLFYAALARAHSLDLDHSNVSLLSVDGVSFAVYKRVLNALEIPWAMRTDNDISNIHLGPQGSQVMHRQLAGINRALSLAGLPLQPHRAVPYDQAASLGDGTWLAVSAAVAPAGIFLSKIDLEHDIATELPTLLDGFNGLALPLAVAYLQGKKATRMQQFVEHCGAQLSAPPPWASVKAADPLHDRCCAGVTMAAFTPSVEQDQAIQCESDMVIVARPGSGKTSVLSCKVRNLVSGLRRHQGIIAISFTNKASDELERRCKADAFDVKSSFFGTIDDFCLREIVFPFARQLMPVAATVKTAKLRELPEAVRHMLPTTPIQDGTVANTAEFLPFLQAALAQGLVPLEAVGMLARYVVEHSPACRNYLIARYRAVYIDEYQDSGYFQHQLFLKLKSLGLTAVAVGDCDQSIYGFAHKDSRYLMELTVPGSSFAYFAITTNFRSHPSINEFALRLLDPNHPVAPTSDMRVLIKTVDGDQRAIGTWLNTAAPQLMRFYQVTAAGRVAILCRHQHSARLIVDHLGLAHHLVEESPFQAAPATEASLFSDVLRLRFDQQLTAEALIEQVGAAKLAASKRRALRRALISCRSCLDSDLVVAVLNAATCLLGQQPSAEGAMELGVVCGDPDKLRRFQSPSPDAVQIMTLHKAKGLEFDLVFHVDLYDHVIPKRIYPPGQNGVFFENEIQCLNLHYVGVTRAVKACVLITSNFRINGQGDVKKGAPSQFIGRNGTNAAPIFW